MPFYFSDLLSLTLKRLPFRTPASAVRQKYLRLAIKCSMIVLAEELQIALIIEEAQQQIISVRNP